MRPRSPTQETWGLADPECKSAKRLQASKSKRTESNHRPQRVPTDVFKMLDIRGCGTEEEKEINSVRDIKLEVLGNHDEKPNESEANSGTIIYSC